MDGHRQPHSLETCAAECIRELDALKRRAQHSHRISSTKELLEAVARKVDNNVRSLQAWNTEFSEGVQTENESITNAIAHFFESLYHSIASARESLDKRLRYRRLYLIGFVPGKR